MGETSVGESCGVLQRKFTVDRERVDCIRGLQHNFTLDRGEWTVFAVYNVNLRWIGGEWGYYACSLVKKKKTTTATALLNETITLKVPVLFFLFFLTIK